MDDKNPDNTLVDMVSNRELMLVFVHFVLNGALRTKDILASFSFSSTELNRHLQYLTQAGIIESRGSEKTLTAFGKEVGLIFNQMYISLRAKAKAVLAQTSCYSGYTVKQIEVFSGQPTDMLYPQLNIDTPQIHSATNLLLASENSSFPEAVLLTERELPETLTRNLSNRERELIVENVQQLFSSKGNEFRRNFGS
jgi:hypothetical protein